ncbi:hypothetical protein BKA16_004670 [Gordonia humi]|uniref:Xaa-Pro dipeptidyl-peptidase C-terminal domain-containing protein n=2 Tax=Gordonia humi TaxID=686429 RepID=A0A840EYA1_9ACTN|nr:hypothetical protein [Gordonia humi]
MTSTDYYNAPWYSPGGALSWQTVWWWATTMALADGARAMARGGQNSELLSTVLGMLADPEPHLQHSPAYDQEALVRQLPWWPDMVGHADRDDYWRHLAVVEHLDEISVPALHVGGWFDIFAHDTTATFSQMRSRAAGAEARDGQRLIMGPWDHLNFSGVYPDRQFGLLGNAEALDLTSTYLKFFDRWLRGDVGALDGTAPVRIFVMGIDQWRDEQDWPLPDTTYTDYFLGGDGRAHPETGGGTLSRAASPIAGVDNYEYDPRDPVPSMGGRLLLPAAAHGAGPVDQRPIEERPDVLCYSTGPLEEAVEVTGHVRLILHATSSALDTDFTGKLVDVYPDGRALYLTDGVLRAKYRDSLSEPQHLEPGRTYELALDLGVTSNVFLPGHQLRLEVSSSNFPRYDRNTNTGRVGAAEKLNEALVARNAVLHGPGRPSRLILPIIDRTRR